MEMNTIYVVVHDNFYSTENCKNIAMVGLDEGGKFFLPLTPEIGKLENGIIIPQGGGCLTCDTFQLVLPPKYRFKLVRHDSDDRKKEKTINDPYIRFIFSRWMPFMQVMGQDTLSLSARVDAETKYFIPISDMFEKRLYDQEAIEEFMRNIDTPYNYPHLELPGMIMSSTD